MIDYRLLMKGRDIKKSILFPFSNQTVYLRMLTSIEESEINKLADIEYKMRELNFQNATERVMFKASIGLSKVIVDEKGNKVYPDHQTFLENTTTEIINKLWREYTAFIDENTPDTASYTEKEMYEMIDSVKKNLNLIWTITDSNLLKKLLHFTVSLLLKQQIIK